MTSADDRIERLEAQVSRLLATVAEQDAKICKLEAENADLRSRLGQNSQNSGKPPSSDPPGATPSKTKPSGKSRGGQPGHPGKTRRLLPPDRVTRLSKLHPRKCKCCGGKNLVDPDVDPRVHQTVDMPKPVLDVHETRMYAGDCADCGERTWATLPQGTQLHLLGPNISAFVALLISLRVSRREVQMLLADVLDLPVSLGALSESEERIGDALETSYDEALEHARSRSVKHLDASSWYIAGRLLSLWAIATSLVTVFKIAPDGKTESVAELMGIVRGILITDRGSQFGFWAMDKRQICWAHLLRKWVAFAEKTDPRARQLGERLLLFTQLMFKHWHDFRERRVTRARLAQNMVMVEKALVNLLEQGAALGVRGVSGSCADVLKHRDALFTFVRIPGVEPTNNNAERALRPFVIWRKTSYGSQSERGCRFSERLMTAARTLRLQKRSLFTFLTETCTAAVRGHAGPSLLPTPQ